MWLILAKRSAESELGEAEAYVRAEGEILKFEDKKAAEELTETLNETRHPLISYEVVDGKL